MREFELSADSTFILCMKHGSTYAKQQAGSSTWQLFFSLFSLFIYYFSSVSSFHFVPFQFFVSLFPSVRGIMHMYSGDLTVEFVSAWVCVWCLCHVGIRRRWYTVRRAQMHAIDRYNILRVYTTQCYRAASIFSLLVGLLNLYIHRLVGRSVGRFFAVCFTLSVKLSTHSGHGMCTLALLE